MSSEQQPKPDSDVVIRIENAGKCYHMYDHPSDRLKQAVMRWKRNYYREFWAVRGVSLEVRRGEAIGIVGRNGSGKSTLLQLIAGTLTPTEGSAQVAGRIAALLELGSGFNPDFTGRENVFLNGAILGLSQREIHDRFDAIAGFADIGAFIDQPVKTYSSGMLVRLAFAVQVQVEPDVLIIDEALAVGDALFQKRCFQRLEELRNSGVTLLFVSHNQESVRTLTSRALLLHQGRVRALGASGEVILEYRRLLHEAETAWGANQGKGRSGPAQLAATTGTAKPKTARPGELSFGSYEAHVDHVRIFDEAGKSASVFKPGELVRIRVACTINSDLTNLNIGLRMYSWGTLNQDISIWSGKSQGECFWDRQFAAGEEVEVEFAFRCILGMDFYEVQAHISLEHDRHYRDQRMLHWVDEAAFFQVIVHQDDYFFGGVCDLQMTATPLNVPAASRQPHP
ncbi:MAG: ABC transporter ATP-binding protein [Planctomycetota bacterium]|nr:ABC transporter ATP-binding protein [Planctomycetota bacterium]